MRSKLEWIGLLMKESPERMSRKRSICFANRVGLGWLVIGSVVAGSGFIVAASDFQVNLAYNWSRYLGWWGCIGFGGSLAGFSTAYWGSLLFSEKLPHDTSGRSVCKREGLRDALVKVLGRDMSRSMKVRFFANSVLPFLANAVGFTVAVFTLEPREPDKSMNFPGHWIPWFELTAFLLQLGMLATVMWEYLGTEDPRVAAQWLGIRHGCVTSALLILKGFSASALITQARLVPKLVNQCLTAPSIHPIGKMIFRLLTSAVGFLAIFTKVARLSFIGDHVFLDWSMPQLAAAVLLINNIFNLDADHGTPSGIFFCRRFVEALEQNPETEHQWWHSFQLALIEQYGRLGAIITFTTMSVDEVQDLMKHVVQR